MREEKREKRQPYMVKKVDDAKNEFGNEIAALQVIFFSLSTLFCRFVLKYRKTRREKKEDFDKVFFSVSFAGGKIRRK